MKSNKGFSLIELLAVIIILGILMIIAVPSVTVYIQNSRKDAYIATVKELINGSKNLVNAGKLGLYNTDTVYYIPTSCIPTENTNESPFGDFTVSNVIVTYNGSGYNYYWAGVDETGTGIPKITSYNELDSDLIQSDVKIPQIPTSDSIEGRNYAATLNETNCKDFEVVASTKYGFTETTSQSTNCAVESSFMCDKGTVGESYITKCDDVYGFETTNSTELNTNFCPASESSFTCDASTLGTSYSLYSKVTFRMWNYETESTNTCTNTGSSFTCNTPNIGREYNVCSIGTSSFSSSTTTADKCIASIRFDCTPETDKKTYTQCTRLSSGKYRKSVFTCHSSYANKKYRCVVNCNITKNECKKTYNVTTKTCVEK